MLYICVCVYSFVYLFVVLLRGSCLLSLSVCFYMCVCVLYVFVCDFSSCFFIFWSQGFNDDSCGFLFGLEYCSVMFLLHLQRPLALKTILVLVLTLLCVVVVIIQPDKYNRNELIFSSELQYWYRLLLSSVGWFLTKTIHYKR